MHHIITVYHKPYDINPFIPLFKHDLSDMGIFFKQKKKKPKHLKNYIYFLLKPPSELPSFPL
jgi:hypothetical protein